MIIYYLLVILVIFNIVTLLLIMSEYNLLIIALNELIICISRFNMLLFCPLRPLEDAVDNTPVALFAFCLCQVTVIQSHQHEQCTTFFTSC